MWPVRRGIVVGIDPHPKHLSHVVTTRTVLDPSFLDKCKYQPPFFIFGPGGDRPSPSSPIRRQRKKAPRAGGSAPRIHILRCTASLAAHWRLWVRPRTLPSVRPGRSQPLSSPSPLRGVTVTDSRSGPGVTQAVTGRWQWLTVTPQFDDLTIHV